MKRMLLPISYTARTNILGCASYVIRIIAKPCRFLSWLLYAVARFIDRTPESLARFVLYVAAPSADEAK